MTKTLWIALTIAMGISFVVLALVHDGLMLAALVMFAVAANRALGQSERAR